MKKVVFLLVCGLIVIAGCTANSWKDKEYRFAQGFADLSALEKTYGGSFKEEQLNATMMPLEQIDAFVTKLQEAQENIKLTKDSKDRLAILNFIDIRKNMVLAEKNFQLARKIGDIGLVEDKGGFTCGEAKYILDTAYYLNETFVLARNAVFGLDSLLYDFGDVEQLTELVGLDNNKTAFYKSPLDVIHKTITKNYEALAKNCKIQVVTKEAKSL